MFAFWTISIGGVATLLPDQLVPSRHMGYGDGQFIGLVDEVYKCSACAGVLENPVFTLCGHVFCSECVMATVVEQHRHLAVGCRLPAPSRRTCERRSGYDNQSPTCGFVATSTVATVRRSSVSPRWLSMLSTVHADPSTAPSSAASIVDGDMLSILHGRQLRHFRPVGVCDNSCGPPLLLRDSHDCLVAMYETRIAHLEAEFRSLLAAYTHSRTAFLARIACLTSQLATNLPQSDQRGGQQDVGAIIILVLLVLYLNIGMKKSIKIVIISF